MAIFLARGGISFTTSPAISTSPEVGFSRPAIIRSRVVFPHPEDPRRTRNSPSLVDRSTPFPACTLPKLFRIFLVSTVAIACLFPSRGPKHGGGGPAPGPPPPRNPPR